MDAKWFIEVIGEQMQHARWACSIKVQERVRSRRNQGRRIFFFFLNLAKVTESVTGGRFFASSFSSLFPLLSLVHPVSTVSGEQIKRESTQCNRWNKPSFSLSLFFFSLNLSIWLLIKVPAHFLLYFSRCSCTCTCVSSYSQSMSVLMTKKETTCCDCGWINVSLRSTASGKQWHRWYTKRRRRESSGEKKRKKKKKINRRVNLNALTRQLSLPFSSCTSEMNLYLTKLTRRWVEWWLGCKYIFYPSHEKGLHQAAMILSLCLPVFLLHVEVRVKRRRWKVQPPDWPVTSCVSHKRWESGEKRSATSKCDQCKLLTLRVKNAVNFQHL